MYPGSPPKVTRHPGFTRIHAFLRRTYFWPQIVSGFNSAARDFLQCAKNRVCLRERASLLKSFPAFEPLESMDIDILGPLSKSRYSFQSMIAMADRFTALVQTVPLKHPPLGRLSGIFETLALHEWTAKDTTLRQ